MVVYSPNAGKPVDNNARNRLAIAFSVDFRNTQDNGFDGKDVALAVISALREFVTYNVGMEGVAEELSSLADELISTPNRHGN